MNRLEQIKKAVKRVQKNKSEKSLDSIIDNEYCNVSGKADKIKTLNFN